MKLRAQVFQGESPAPPRQTEVEGGCEEGTTLARELLQRIEHEHE
jgi:hypothetical protein